MSENIRIPLEISIFEAVATAALCAIVIPIGYRIGQKITERFFSWKDETAH